MEQNEILRKYRILNGLTQKDVAEKIGMTHSGYSKYERGERKISFDLLWKLLPILKIPTSAFANNEEMLMEQHTMEYEIQYSDLAKAIKEKMATMSEAEKNNARNLFRSVYERIEKEKKQIINLLQPEKIDDIIKVYGLEFLYQK